MKGAARLRPTRVGLATLAGACLWPCAPAQDAAAAGTQAPSFNLQAAQYAACDLLAQAPWPRQDIARRAHLHRLESARPQCVGHAAFLAALGALWLEEGEADQALIWLERSLLLDPGSLGAQADHALALAALGQPEALQSLAQAWRLRSDVPASLRDRLVAPKVVSASAPLPTVRLGGAAGVPNGRWASHREATLLMGYESNLDNSPRLTEITLTPIGGPIQGSLVNPLSPRRGAALLSELSWQIARSPYAGQIWRAGLHLGARAAPGESKTDWHQVQWAASGSQQSGPWRGQIELSGTWIGGPLNEPYRLLRISATGERDALGCRLKLAVEAQARTQRQTSIADGRTVGALWSSQCPISSARGWAWGAAVRGSIDEPADAARAGGTQRLWSLGARLLGPVGAATRLDASLRVSRVHDDQGYSQLLENNARRQLSQSQISLEFTRPLNLAALPGAEAIAQVQAVRQASNLAIFRYSGVSTYGGIRWAW